MTEDRATSKATTVRALFDAFRQRRREDAAALIAADFAFTSPYDDGIDRTAYFARCWPNGDRFAEFRIERVVADPDGAFVTYWCTTNDGTSFRNTEYLTVANGQVTSVNVYFGATYRDGIFVAQQTDS